MTTPPYEFAARTIGPSIPSRTPRTNAPSSLKPFATLFAVLLGRSTATDETPRSSRPFTTLCHVHDPDHAPCTKTTVAAIAPPSDLFTEVLLRKGKPDDRRPVVQPDQILLTRIA